jgi:hypothetical protein
MNKVVMEALIHQLQFLMNMGLMGENIQVLVHLMSTHLLPLKYW